MKFILVLLFVGVALAQDHHDHDHHNGRSLVESLANRAEALLKHVHETLKNARGTHNHLLQALEHQAVAIEALAMDLRAQLKDEHREHHMHHIHTIEEDLLFLENRVSEEIAILHHFQDGHHHHNGDNHQRLLERAEQLLKEAKETIEKHPHERNSRELESEMIVIEALVRTIKTRPDESELKKDEEELARHEKSVRQLIEKINHRHNHHDH
ncbi:hypothetical protein BLOT_015882 [Blomia tropicalis]|nr:hypothetical protein BLOT_015882 [Blomia tropicalis]